MIDDLPPYDPFFDECEGFTEETWRVQKEIEKNQQLADDAKASLGEHPGARETLFQACVRSAVKRAGAGELTKIIEANLRDKDLVPDDCKYVTHWAMRKARG